jgi:hypothetical protein
VVLGLLSPNYLVNDVLANPETAYGIPDFGLISSSPGVFWALDHRSEPAAARIDQCHKPRLANQLHVLVFKRLTPVIPDACLRRNRGALRSLSPR